MRNIVGYVVRLDLLLVRVQIVKIFDDGILINGVGLRCIIVLLHIVIVINLHDLV